MTSRLSPMVPLLLMLSAACEQPRDLLIVSIEVSVDSAFADSSQDACLGEGEGEGEGDACTLAEGGVVLDGCTPLSRDHDDLAIGDANVPLADVVGAVELNHVGPDGFVVSHIDVFGFDSVGRRTDVLLVGRALDVVAAHDPSLVLYRVAADGVVLAGDVVGTPPPADEMEIRYASGAVDVVERHRVLARDTRPVTVRRLNELECGCGAAPSSSIAFSALCALGFARLARRRARAQDAPHERQARAPRA